MRALIVAVASGVLTVIAAGGVYLAAVKHLHWAVIRPVLQPRIVRADLTDPRLRQLVQLMNDEHEGRRDSFAVFWNARNTELVSRRIGARHNTARGRPTTGSASDTSTPISRATAPPASSSLAIRSPTASGSTTTKRS